jgi:amino acid permease
MQLKKSLNTLEVLLSFFTTANAGILSASRVPMAMSLDGLLPQVFGKVSAKGTPVFRAPLFPYLQIAGIIIYSLLIVSQGGRPLLIAAGSIAVAHIWYANFRRRGYSRTGASLSPWSDSPSHSLQPGQTHSRAV